MNTDDLQRDSALHIFDRTCWKHESQGKNREKTELHVLSPEPSLELVSGCSIATGSPCFRPQDHVKVGFQYLRDYANQLC